MAATVWKGHLSFGLISIPVRLYRAARAERVTLRQLARAAAPEPEIEIPRGNVVELPARGVEPRFEPPAPRDEPESFEPPAAVERIRQAPVSGPENRPVSPGDMLKGYEVDRDQWVVLDKQELKSIAPKTSKVIDVLEFVRFSEIDPVYLETSYYLAPEPSGEKAYALLHQALAQAGYAGLGRVAMHNREHILVIRAGRRGLIAHTMFFADEVRGEGEHGANLALVSEKELQLAVTFVETLAAGFDPAKYRDSYRDRLQALIESKAQGKALAATAEAEPAGPPVGDLMAALEQSLALARKPAASETPAPAAERKPAAKKAGRKG